MGIPSLSLSFSICTMRKLGQIVSVGSPGPATLPSSKNMGFGTKSSGRNNFSLLDVWPLAPQSSSLSPFPHLWNKDFQHEFPLSHSIFAWWLVLIEIVKTSRREIFIRNPTPPCKNTHTHNLGGDTKPFFSDQLHPGSLWVHPLLRVGTRFFLRGALGFPCPSSPGAKSYTKNAKA